MTTRHLLVELHGCDPRALDDAERLQSILLRAVRAIGGTFAQSAAHASPRGATVFALSTTSRAWLAASPELGYASVDVITSALEIDNAIAQIVDELGARTVETAVVHRGLGPSRSMEMIGAAPASIPPGPDR